MRSAVKRLLDIFLSAAGLVVASPIILVTGLVVRFSLGSPVLFRQKRPGLRAKPFTLLKFRTMTDARDRGGRLLPDSQRLTGIGSTIRRFSLDELPQLWNVLKGDLSIVGPRPLLMQYLDRYTPEQMRRHEVKPGITGWAQVNGRNALSWEEKFRLDVWYVDHWSLWLDFRILARTLLMVISGKGLTQEGHATMEEFMGTCCDSHQLSEYHGENREIRG
ncbi:sugar transferase [Desulfomonile tiedjei]|uniref:Glycosyl transferase possibly involved in lipopolysaccharide synthesis n=1 Tax=Desulfomonile tiedjei (strain ATCC 49306 / DSM 6799 / DCB-1) TaxID=706587 RepID=I4C7E1_DESTA|nr:sugar transferase [Desulfomonile tiedjei]AFM25482.1 glycosyl transferase possibly involved in lipopolysaccharide synthesis [Desulfomonile tiedjei DSM 6799]